MFWFRKEPPPPPPLPIYKKRPIATAAVLLTIISTFILGPVGVIFNGLTEDLKLKANNETLLMYMKQQKETNDRQWKMIEQKPQPIQQPRSINKSSLTPSQFQDYMNMSPQNRAAFRKLNPAYATLPE